MQEPKPPSRHGHGQWQKYVLPIFALVLTVAAVALVLPRFLPESFTKKKWDNATPARRDRLLHGLARSGILIGLPEEEIYAMLGKPDGSSSGQAIYYFRTEGHPRPCLAFSFSRDGHVTARNLYAVSGTTSNSEFDAESWRDGSPPVRLSMVRDLLATHQLAGMSREEVYALLGNPDRETQTEPKVWYCRTYYGENGEIKKRLAGASKCLYLYLRDGRVADAKFTGS